MNISSSKLGLVVAMLMSAFIGILLTALLHGEILAILGSGFQYWLMVPVFFNMLQVRVLCARKRMHTVRNAAQQTPPEAAQCRCSQSPPPHTNPPPARQVNAFANADDISWGTKNLDKKGHDHEAAKMASKALAYQVRPSKTSKAFWDAMGKVQSHLTDAKKIAAYNARKEQKMKVGRGPGELVGAG